MAELTWRLLRDGALPGGRNMALDHALASCLSPGEAVLRLYGWSRPTISFGRNEPARDRYASLGELGEGPASRAAGGPPADFVRRPTGGRAVAHWRELTYAVVAPVDAFGGMRAAYVAINGALAGALRALGVDVDLAGGAAEDDSRGSPTRTLPGPDAGPCFRAPAPGEVTAGGRKFVGSAQARVGKALLQHGSILIEDDQGLLDGVGAGETGRPEAGRPATLRELAGDVSIDALADQVAMSLRETFGGKWVPEGVRPAELEVAERLEEERYARASWTWRR